MSFSAITARAYVSRCARRPRSQSTPRTGSLSGSHSGSRSPTCSSRWSARRCSPASARADLNATEAATTRDLNNASQSAAIGATTTAPLVYDFWGFPEEFYRIQYPAPGAPELAQRVRELVGAGQPVAEEPERGLDHGAYVPLMAMYPEADVPVLQVSLPTLDAPSLFELGRRLAPLREEGVLIVGGGFLTHNLRAADWRAVPQTPSWASEFDHWAAEALAACDVDALVEYERRAPGVQYALPTREHFVPAVVSLGSAVDAPGEVSFPITGWLAGSLTKRSVQFG